MDLSSHDNGIGFTQLNRDSFDELYTEQKKSDGGRALGASPASNILTA
jgi:hypothetical protein